MATSKTKPSTRRLSEIARHVVIPDGIVSTGWPSVEAKCAELGDEFDEWQRGAGKVILGKREDGVYAATVGGVTLSIPRQVAKTFLVGRIVIALCLLFPGLTVLWSAHHTRTATKTFGSLKAATSRPRVKPHMLEPRNANGEQEIRFRNGSVIMFGAREQGFGRGFDEVDIEVFDEAQILTEKALEDMVAATNQSRHEAGALLFFMGTPPRPTDPGEAFTNRRHEALSGQSEDTVYIECSADQDADPDDRDQWGKANPSYPHRTPLRSLLRLRKNLSTDDAWLREALGIWAPEGSQRVIPADAWKSVRDVNSMAVDRFALGVDVCPDRCHASIALAGRRDDGNWHIELDEQRSGVGWLVPYIERLVKANPQVRAVVIDGASPAASIIDELKTSKVKATTTTAGDMANACGQLYDGVMELWLRHTDQPQMNYALSVARKRPLLDRWAWNRKDAASDITPVVAATLALWGAQSTDVKKPARRPRSEGRRAVVL